MRDVKNLYIFASHMLNHPREEIRCWTINLLTEVEKLNVLNVLVLDILTQIVPIGEL